MLSVADALAEILREVQPLPAITVSLEGVLGQVLADDVISDVDSPPFDKALMDGYAVRAADVVQGGSRLQVIEEVTAGRVPTRIVGTGEATQIMTGAPMPEGADAVIRIEDTRLEDGACTVTAAVATVAAGTNVLKQATAMKRGDRVLESGRMLRPQEIGALAETGKACVSVYRRPRVAVLATGDELVSAGETPGPGQIRNSNEPMLVAQIDRAGGEAVPLGIARDERSELRARIDKGLECDVLLLSGGVSAGKLDLVPSELQSAGVREVFHKVQVKPGKPIWFGVRDRDDAAGVPRCVVFGLPGNPVSSMVCFELFARTAIRRLMGVEPAEPQPLQVSLSQDHVARGDRPTYYPARLFWESAGPAVRPVDWHGSADLRATVDANCMALFPPGNKTYSPGDRIDVIEW